MPTPREIALAEGYENVDAAIEAAERVGLPLYAAFALLRAESYGGRNVFGSDSGGMFPGQKVTKEKFEKLEASVAAGGRANGVGPTQITHKSHLPAARKQGLELWVPLDNMLYGFGLLKRHYDAKGSWRAAGTAYNGKSSYGTSFNRFVEEWKRRLDGATEEDPVAAWHLAPSLKKLQSDLDAEFGASRPNDGTIGDQAHAARSSEHNPDNDPDPMPKGAVSAIDVYTQANGKTYITAAEFAKFLAILKKDSRVWYVIHKGKIYSRTNNFATKNYDGSNPHNTHIHISLMQTKAAHDSVASWKLSGIRGGDSTPTPPSSGGKKLPTLSQGDRDKVLVPFLKRFFWKNPPNTDEVFGSGTAAKVRAYQLSQGLVADGVVGPQTWKKIAAGGTKLPAGYAKP